MQILGYANNPVAGVNVAPAFAQIGNEVHLTNASAAAAARMTEEHIIQRFPLFFICMHVA